ncbi:MAG: hypothetical protein ACJ77S_09930, partial [Gemmatimonadaceae bacterium]
MRIEGDKVLYITKFGNKSGGVSCSPLVLIHFSDQTLDGLTLARVGHAVLKGGDMPGRKGGGHVKNRKKYEALK